MSDKKINILILVISVILIFSLGLYGYFSQNKTGNQTKIQNQGNGKDIINQDTKGKKMYVGFVSTSCPHCVEAMPILDNFYKQYKNDVIMQMIVVNGQKFEGNYEIPQDISNSLSYEDATKEKCDYVPNYIIYDENKNIIEKKCGGALTEEELKQKLLPQILETNKNDTNMNNINQTGALQNGDIAVIMTTTNGKITIKMFPELAPKTVLNFLALSKKGYYNGIVFHRVIKDFMIQGGDPTATGMGGESIFGKEFEDEFNDLKNIRGSLSMANAGEDTNGSQFFINQKDNNFLDGKHTVFGQVIEGLENVDKIANSKTGENDKPEKEIKIIKMEIMKFENNSLKSYDYKYEDELKKIEEINKTKSELNKTREVKIGDKIKVNYIGTKTKDGTKFDSSYDRGTTLDFEVGAGMMIPGFDKGVIGMKIGDKKILKLLAKDAYGEYDEKNIQEIPKIDLKQFEDAGIKLEKGSKLPTQYGEFEIKEVSKDTVKVDVNHTLAGQDLTFEVEMVGFDN